MAMYLTRFTYTPESWAKLIHQPEDRRPAVTPSIEAEGGKLHGLWYAFGEHDGYALVELPDNVTMASMAFAICAGGAVSSFQTTVLMTVEETLAALEKARTIPYVAVGDSQSG